MTVRSRGQARSGFRPSYRSAFSLSSGPLWSIILGHSGNVVNPLWYICCTMLEHAPPTNADGGRRAAGSRGRSFAGQNIPGRATHHDVLAQLASAIRLGSLRFGDRLPSERLLADQCGVSRATVRKALQVLADAGVLDIRSGRGP